MNTLGATRATTVTFLLPVTAVFWGASILREAITIPILAGMAVILLGVFLTSRQRTRRTAAPAADRSLPEISSSTGTISR
jgi:drug/metabolite transporter (DMT)-like permease